MSLQKIQKFKILLLNESDQPIKTIVYINSKTSEQYSIHKKNEKNYLLTGTKIFRMKDHLIHEIDPESFLTCFYFDPNVITKCKRALIVIE